MSFSCHNLSYQYGIKNKLVSWKSRFFIVLTIILMLLYATKPTNYQMIRRKLHFLHKTTNE